MKPILRLALAAGLLSAASGAPLSQVETDHLAALGSDLFGFDVVLRDDVLVAGARGDDEAGTDAGAAFVFLRDDHGTPDSAFDDEYVVQQKLVPAGLVAGDELGTRVDTHGDVVVITALRRDGAFTDSGAVFVYQRDRRGTADPSDDVWVELDELRPSSSFPYQFFGQWVVVHADTIAVGMRDDTNPTDEKVFLFERQDAGTPLDPFDDSWIETTYLEELPERTRYGWSLDLDDDTLYVGARWYDQTPGDDNSGTVYAYFRDDRGTPSKLDDVWVAGPTISPLVTVLDGEFGRDVEVLGDTLLVGAWHTYGSGAAYVYERDRRGTADPADDVWVETAIVSPSDGNPGDSFGNGLSLGADVLLVGAFGHDQPANNTGEVYVYRRDDAGTPGDPFDDAWPEVARLGGSQAGTGDQLGNQVSVFQGTAAAGALAGEVVHVYDLDGFLQLGVETEDDWRTPLANGQVVATDAGFGRWLGIAGTSASGLEAAAFDSSFPGPNVPGEDLDLLVGTGNVLILQERPEQTVPGIYDVPDDDRFGGLLELEFLGGVATPLRVSLVDVDALPGQDVFLTLRDELGATRTYHVPSGWTEDVALQGPPGFRVLDLTTLAPQPGFLAVATAQETPGFDGQRVVGLTVEVLGSAALDDLCWTVNGSTDPAADAAARSRRPTTGGPLPALLRP